MKSIKPRKKEDIIKAFDEASLEDKRRYVSLLLDILDEKDRIIDAQNTIIGNYEVLHANGKRKVEK